MRSGLRDRQRGSIAVEFAVLMIPFMFMVAGLIDFSHAYYLQQRVTDASRSGARYGVRFVPDANGARTAPGSLNPSIAQWVKTRYGDDLEVTTEGTGFASNKPGDPLAVTVKKSQDIWLFYGFLSQYVTLPDAILGKTTMTLE